ncbi:hypothetical protein BDF19DRAFT_465858 [Syncephalis fuscata]|nr:hypothetical protein BDF19DRAFT_465858 [Syncephalis fuscata]
MLFKDNFKIIAVAWVLTTLASLDYTNASPARLTARADQTPIVEPLFYGKAPARLVCEGNKNPTPEYLEELEFYKSFFDPEKKSKKLSVEGYNPSLQDPEGITRLNRPWKVISNNEVQCYVLPARCQYTLQYYISKLDKSLLPDFLSHLFQDMARAVAYLNWTGKAYGSFNLQNNAICINMDKTNKPMILLNHLENAIPITSNELSVDLKNIGEALGNIVKTVYPNGLKDIENVPFKNKNAAESTVDMLLATPLMIAENKYFFKSPQEIAVHVSKK